MLEFEGEQTLDKPLQFVWEKLSDVRFLIHCVPRTVEISEVREDHAVCKQKTGFSFAQGTLRLTVDRTQMEPEKSVTYRMFSKGIGSTSDVESTLKFEPNNGGTKVQWKAHIIELGGLLSAVPQGLIGGAAQKVITEVWDAVFKRLREIDG